MTHLQTRISKLEGQLGANDRERWLRSLTDEQLEARIAELDNECRALLTAQGVACDDMPIKEVIAHLEDLEKAGADR